MVNYRQPVNSLGQAANIGQGNLLERVSILETRKRILVADASEEFRRVFTGALEEESGLELAAETEMCIRDRAGGVREKCLPNVYQKRPGTAAVPGF